MKLVNEFTVAAPIEETWTTLLDVERVASCLPGASIEPVGEDGSYRGRMRVKVGPVSMAYGGTVRLAEVDTDSHVAAFEARAKETRGTGTAAATIRNILTETADGTRVQVETDLDVTGRPAQFGRGLMEEVASKMLGQFSGRLEKLVLDGAADGFLPGRRGRRGAGRRRRRPMAARHRGPRPRRLPPTKRSEALDLGAAMLGGARDEAPCGRPRRRRCSRDLISLVLRRRPKRGLSFSISYQVVGSRPGADEGRNQDGRTRLDRTLGATQGGSAPPPRSGRLRRRPPRRRCPARGDPPLAGRTRPARSHRPRPGPRVGRRARRDHRRRPARRRTEDPDADVQARGNGALPAAPSGHRQGPLLGRAGGGRRRRIALPRRGRGGAGRGRLRAAADCARRQLGAGRGRIAPARGDRDQPGRRVRPRPRRRRGSPGLGRGGRRNHVPLRPPCRRSDGAARPARLPRGGHRPPRPPRRREDRPRQPPHPRRDARLAGGADPLRRAVRRRRLRRARRVLPGGFPDPLLRPAPRARRRLDRGPRGAPALDQPLARPARQDPHRPRRRRQTSSPSTPS